MSKSGVNGRYQTYDNNKYYYSASESHTFIITVFFVFFNLFLNFIGLTFLLNSYLLFMLNFFVFVFLFQNLFLIKVLQYICIQFFVIRVVYTDFMVLICGIIMSV